MCHPLILRLSKTIWFVFTKMYPGKKYGDLCRCSALRSLKKDSTNQNQSLGCFLLPNRILRHFVEVKMCTSSTFTQVSLAVARTFEGLGLTVTQCPTRHRTTQGLTSTIIDRPSRPFITDVMF